MESESARGPKDKFRVTNVELDVVPLKTPSHVSIPHVTIAKVALLIEKFISAECLR